MRKSGVAENSLNSLLKFKGLASPVMYSDISICLSCDTVSRKKSVKCLFCLSLVRQLDKNGNLMLQRRNVLLSRGGSSSEKLLATICSFSNCTFSPEARTTIGNPSTSFWTRTYLSATVKLQQSKFSPSQYCPFATGSLEATLTPLPSSGTEYLWPASRICRFALPAHFRYCPLRIPRKLVSNLLHLQQFQCCLDSSNCPVPIESMLWDLASLL